MLIHGIDTADISVIVQGNVAKETEKCLKSIRKCLPNSEIILSTWHGAETNGLDYDTLVLSDDPGSLGWHFYGNKIVPFNYNRQIVSTKAGLEKSNRKYTLKIRSDFFLKNAVFLSHFEDFPLRNKEATFFKHRVIVPSVYTRMFFSETGFPTPFCVSDFFFFGLTDDVKDYFDSEIITSDDGCNWHFLYPDRKPDIKETGRYAPEQFLCYGWAKRHGIACSFEDCSDWNMKNLAVSNAVLFSNFIVLDSSRLELASAKHDLPRLEKQYGLVSSAVFEEEYKRIFLNNEPEFCMERYANYWKPRKRCIIWKFIAKVARFFLQV